MTDPLTHSEAYFYDGDGNVTEVIDRDGRMTLMTYDGDNRKLTETWLAVGGTATEHKTFQYDPDGNLLLGQNSAGSYNLTYDIFGEVTQVSRDTNHYEVTGHQLLRA